MKLHLNLLIKFVASCIDTVQCIYFIYNNKIIKYTHSNIHYCKISYCMLADAACCFHLKFSFLLGQINIVNCYSSLLHKSFLNTQLAHILPYTIHIRYNDQMKYHYQQKNEQAIWFMCVFTQCSKKICHSCSKNIKNIIFIFLLQSSFVVMHNFKFYFPIRIFGIFS